MTATSHYHDVQVSQISCPSQEHITFCSWPLDKAYQHNPPLTNKSVSWPSVTRRPFMYTGWHKHNHDTQIEMEKEGKEGKQNPRRWQSLKQFFYNVYITNCVIASCTLTSVWPRPRPSCLRRQSAAVSFCGMWSTNYQLPQLLHFYAHNNNSNNNKKKTPSSRKCPGKDVSSLLWLLPQPCTWCSGLLNE